MSTPRLDPEIMDKIVRLAQAMRDRGKDKYHMAHALLYLHARNRLLEDLYRKVQRYLHSGMAEQELTELRKAVERLREADVKDADAAAFFAKE